MSLLLSALQYGCLRLIKLPRLSVPTLLSLGGTLGLLIASITLTHSLLFSPVPGIAHSDELQSLNLKLKFDEKFQINFVHEERFWGLQQAFAETAGIAYLNELPTSAVVDGATYSVSRWKVSPGALQVLGTHIVQGKAFPTEFSPNQAWVSEAFIDQLGVGAEQALQMAVTVDENEHQIVGVVPTIAGPNSATYALQQSQVVVMFDAKGLAQQPDSGRLSSGGHLLLRTKPGKQISIEDIAAWHKETVANLTNERARVWMSELEPVIDLMPLRQFLLGSASDLIWLLQAVSIGLLLMAVINLLNLFAGYYQGRRAEFATSQALGARKRQLYTQLSVENLPLILLSLTLGLLLSAWLLRLLPTFVEGSSLYVSHVQLGAPAIVVGACCVVLLAVGFALLGASPVKSQHLLSHLNNSGKGAARNTGQSGLVAMMAVQLLLALGLSSLGVLMARQSIDAVYAPLGFSMQGQHYEVLLEPKDPARRKELNEYDDYASSEIRQIEAEIQGFAESNLPHLKTFMFSGTPLSSTRSISSFEGENELTFTFSPEKYSQSYFNRFDIPVLAGRLPTDEEMLANRDWAVLDQDFAERLYPELSPEQWVGQPVTNSKGESKYSIVAVVGNIKRGVGRLHYSHFPTIYATSSSLGHQMKVLLSFDEEKDRTESLRAVFANAHSEFKVIDVSSLDKQWQEATQVQRTLLWVVLATTAVIVLLATVGAVGFARIVLHSKGYELGIRLALGAGLKRLLLLLAGPIIVASAISLVLVAVTLTKFYPLVAEQINQLPDLQWLPLTLTLLGILLIVLVSVVVPGWRSLQQHPAQRLREL